MVLGSLCYVMKWVIGNLGWYTIWLIEDNKYSIFFSIKKRSTIVFGKLMSMQVQLLRRVVIGKKYSQPSVYTFFNSNKYLGQRWMVWDWHNLGHRNK